MGASDVTCGTNKVLKANSASITGSTEALCCDDACSGVTCAAGSHLRANAASIAGTATTSGGVCCEANLCQCNDAMTNDYTCTNGGSYITNAISTYGYTG